MIDLKTAVFNNDFETVKLLIKNGDPVNIESGICIFNAVYNNNYEITKYLIDHNANLNLNIDKLLSMVISNNNIKILKLLIDNGCGYRFDHDKILRWSAFYGNLEMFKYLMNICDFENNKDIVLKYAIDNKSYNIILYLIKLGIDIEIIDTKLKAHIDGLIRKEKIDNLNVQ